ncbi:MAG: hypothetical protein IJI44_07220 [Erysipelotrichaceae bacterium]|nr:hypothetical protein [Erysipelotrichaceae bacterium]
MMILFLIFIGVLFLEMVFGLIGFVIRLCFYLSPFGLLYLLLRPLGCRRHRIYRGFYY